MAADYFDYILDGIPEGEETAWKDIAAALEQSQARRKEWLAQELAQIEQQLTDRDRVHQTLVADLEAQITRYTKRLDHLYTIGKGRTDGTREQLKDRLAAFYRELRDEHRAHWRDRQDLEQERRDIRRELAATTDDTLADLLE